MKRKNELDFDFSATRDFIPAQIPADPKRQSACSQKLSDPSSAINGS
jgi:hypothetical protein